MGITPSSGFISNPIWFLLIAASFIVAAIMNRRAKSSNENVLTALTIPILCIILALNMITFFFLNKEEVTKNTFQALENHYAVTSISNKEGGDVFVPKTDTAMPAIVELSNGDVIEEALLKNKDGQLILLISNENNSTTEAPLR